MLTLGDVHAFRALLARAPEAGNLRQPNAVSAFFSRWRQWRAEAEALVIELERARAEQPQQPSRSPQTVQKTPLRSCPWSRSPSGVRRP